MQPVNISLEQVEHIQTASDLLMRIYDLKEQSELCKLNLPIDVKSIFEKVSKVTFSKEPSFDDWDKSGYIKVERDINNNVSQVSVWVNPSEAPVRQRFTAAHELGHLVYDIVPNLNDTSKSEAFIDKLHRDGTSSFKETRANKFAAQLLMPKELMKKQVDELIAEHQKAGLKITLEFALERLSATFGVSKPSMKIRLENLGFI